MCTYCALSNFFFSNVTAFPDFSNELGEYKVNNDDRNDAPNYKIKTMVGSWFF